MNRDFYPIFAAWAIALPCLLVGAVLVIGATVEHFEQGISERDRCQRQAVSPYDYHRC